MNRSTRSLVALRVAPLVFVVACASLLAVAGANSAAAMPAASSAEAARPIRFDVANMDRTADPCVDFYQYACGGWMKANPIPADQTRWGRFQQLADDNLAALHTILDRAAQAEPGRSSVTKRIGDFYASCVDEGTVNGLESKPLEPTLKRISKIRDMKGLIETMATLHGGGTPGLFTLYSSPDMHDATSMIVHVDQGGLTLPDRDLYLKDDDKSKETRDRYRTHVEKMLTLLGDKPDDAKAAAATVLKIEIALAAASMDRTMRREPKNRDHKMTSAALIELAPNFLLAGYFTNRGIAAPESLNVVNPEFFKQVNPLLAATPLADWKTYLRWKVVNDAAPQLARQFVDEDFAFNRAYMNGQKENQPRWKRCVRMVDQSLGEDLGQAYVEQQFGADNKARTLAMVNQLEKAMAADFQALSWMSDATKKAAQVKLDAIRNHIGYPDKWRDLSPIEIRRNDLFGNIARAGAFETRRQLGKIGKPVDRDEWSMTAPTVNAQYRSSMNDINFPAGILRPPFFDVTADDAINYGGIGGVIGHELTHGFDDSGSQYDANGNFTSWWTPEDRAEFDKRTGCIADEYSGFLALDDVHLNGRLTLGENTADNGGAKIAFMALRSSMNESMNASMSDRPAGLIDGFTQDQRFFLGFAQIWCQNVTPQTSRVLAMTDPHSPGRYRVNGVVQNSAEFQGAFACKAGQPMVSENACRVW